MSQILVHIYIYNMLTRVKKDLMAQSSYVVINVVPQTFKITAFAQIILYELGVRPYYYLLWFTGLKI